MDTSTSHLSAKIWNPVLQEYNIIEMLGQGSFGQVVKAKHRVSQEIVAIKYIHNCFSNQYESRKLLREIRIMRKFNEMKHNNSTVAIKDIILPEGVIVESK